MYLADNKVVTAFEQKKPAFGLYLMTPSTRLVEFFAGAGFDFIRLDLEAGVMNIETLGNLILASHAAGITPFVRVDGVNEYQIHTALRLGAMGIIIPKVDSVAKVQEAIRYTKGAPLGERAVRPMNATGGYGRAGADEYVEWADRNIVLSAQIETKSGVEAIDEIVALDGLDMVQSGRGDLSSYYTPGDQYSDEVIAAERRVIEAGMAAGKMTSVQYYPVRKPDDVQRVQAYIEKGVYCLSLGVDADLIAPFANAINQIKG